MSDKTEWRNRIVGEGEQPASQFVANPANWRVHPQNQRDAMRGALNEVGWVQRVIVNRRTGYLIDGHERVRQALQNGDAPVPYVEVDLDEAEEAYVLATLDPIGAMAQADKEQLDALLREVQSGEAGVQAMLSELAEKAGLYPEAPKEVPEPQVDRAEELRGKWQTERGQVWEIPSATVKGKCHRLMCGDSTSAEDVERLMAGEKAALLCTDPPYNVGITYGEQVDDGKAPAAYEAFTRGWFYLWRAHSERQIVTPGGVNHVTWARWFDATHIGAWLKTNALTHGRVSNSWCWEPVFFFGDGWTRTRANDVFDYPIGMQRDTADHPCPKPQKMWQDLLNHYSARGAVVADAFDGAGTTLVAAETLGRLCYGMEIEPKYVAVALQRLADMGLEPRLVE